MTKKKAPGRATKKLTLKKQTIKDLNPKTAAGNVKGGARCNARTRSGTQCY
jgi:hypothetical protein